MGLASSHLVNLPSINKDFEGRERFDRVLPNGRTVNVEVDQAQLEFGEVSNELLVDWLDFLAGRTPSRGESNNKGLTADHGLIKSKFKLIQRCEHLHSGCFNFGLGV